MSIEAMKQALDLSTPKIREMVTRHAAAIDPRATLEDMPEALAFQIDMARALLREFAAIQQAEVQQPAVGERLMGQVSLPDGSAFAIASFPLPKAHWLYAPREYATGAEEPLELPTPILTHDQREAVVAAIRYAVRGATMCGREQDFDPDAMVQNAVYALCGPYARVSAENTQASVNLALSQQPATGERTVPQEYEAYSRYLDATTPEPDPVVMTAEQAAERKLIEDALAQKGQP